MSAPNTTNMRASTRQKYMAVQARFKQLYSIERLRLDDVHERLCTEFFLSIGRIYIILKTDLGDG